MWKPFSTRLDPAVIDTLRELYGLPETIPRTVVGRYVLMRAAGATEAELADALDSTKGVSSPRYRRVKEQEARIAAIAAEYGVAA